MKNLIYPLLVFLPSLSNAQGQKWSEQGNTGTSSTFLGTINPAPLILKTNNTVRIIIDEQGNINYEPFANIGRGIWSFDTQGKVAPLIFSGSTTDVLTGDGTFQNAGTLSGWKVDNGHIIKIASGNVGIGTYQPLKPLHVVGDALIQGTISVEGLHVLNKIITDTIKSGKIALIGGNMCLGEGGTFNTICTFNTDLRINDKPNLDKNTIFSASNQGRVGIGVANPVEKLEVGGNIKGYGNGEFNGNLKIGSSITFANNKGIIFLPSGNGIPESYEYGGSPNYTPSPMDVCLFPALNTPTLHRFNGTIQCYGNSVQGGQQNVLSLGFDGANGYMDIAGQNAQGSPKLLLNYYCGNDVVIGNPASNNSSLSVAGTINAGDNITTTGNINAASFSLNGNQVNFSQWSNITANKISYNGNTDVHGAISAVSGNNEMRFLINSGTSAEIGSNTGEILFWHGSAPGSGWNKLIAGTLEANDKIIIQNSGTVNFKVDVNGEVYARRVKVTTDAIFPDYVFHKDYKLRKISELESFINENGHLPNMPSAEKIAQDGSIDITDLQLRMLEKIEELSLYVIELKKENELIKKQMKSNTVHK